ncbi:leucine-rich repeat neuronal protein 1-like [Ptychodera flava]|uniref:leucine-rich repeat neuronal protein 1-like n=1 Tax=Ptychodera flava TaxID=63121 RepID=UPI00396A62BE
MFSNPWSCDCRLRELTAWLDENSYRIDFGSTMVCQSPDNHRSRSILDVPSANLTCYPIPVFYTTSKTIVTEIGNNVILDCEVESELEVDKYWIIPNGTVIHQSTEDVCSDYRIVQQGNGSLLIPFVEVDDEGSYSCVASNLEGTTSGVRVLKINLTSSHVTTDTMSTVSEMISTAPKSAGILAYFLGIITASLCVIAFLTFRYYHRAKPKRSDDNDNYANYNFGCDSSDTSSNQVGYHVERSEARIQSARREHRNDHYRVAS